MVGAPPPAARQTWSALRYFVFLLWLSAALATALAIFTNGFLLRRQVLDERSNVTAGQPVFSKAILVVVDALRYDFARWDDDGSQWGTEDGEQHHRNRLPIVRELQERGTAKVYAEGRALPK